MSKRAKSLPCPACNCGTTTVTDSGRTTVRNYRGLEVVALRRRRSCPKCSFSFTTAEVAAIDAKLTDTQDRADAPSN